MRSFSGAFLAASLAATVLASPQAPGTQGAAPAVPPSPAAAAGGPPASAGPGAATSPAGPGVAAAAGGPGAVTGGPGGAQPPGACCMTDAQADKVASNFASLIASYSAANADAYLTTDFLDYSDSVNELINNACDSGPAPLGSPTFTSLAEFKAGQGSQPDIPFERLNLWHNCDTVFLRWRTAMTPQSVTGIIVLEANWNPAPGATQPWLIKTVYSEFNSGAWLVDLGTFKPTNCSAH